MGAAVRQIALPDVSPADLDDWHGLVGRAAEPNVFFEPGFLLPIAEHLPEPDTSLLVVDGPDGWQACMPVQRARVGRVLPVLRTWLHVYCFLGTPLLDAATAPDAACALLEGAIQHAPGSRVGLALLTEGGPAGAALHQAMTELKLAPLRQSSHERAFLERRAEGDYLAGIRSHRRRELNRLGRRLAAELDGELVVTDQAGSEAAVDTFLELERSGWKGRSATAMASAPADEAFFRSLCRTFADDSRLQLLALSVDTRTVAMKCNLTAGDGAFCFKIAHDERLGGFSPGVQLERENVRLFHRERAEQWQDSCAAPQNEMINRLWPDRRTLSTTLCAPSGMRSSFARTGIQIAQTVRNRRTSSPTF